MVIVDLEGNCYKDVVMAEIEPAPGEMGSGYMLTITLENKIKKPIGFSNPDKKLLPEVLDCIAQRMLVNSSGVDLREYYSFNTQLDSDDNCTIIKKDK